MKTVVLNPLSILAKQRIIEVGNRFIIQRDTRAVDGMIQVRDINDRWDGFFKVGEDVEIVAENV